MSTRRWKRGPFARTRPSDHDALDKILDDPNATNEPVARVIAQAAGPGRPSETAGLEAARAAFARSADEPRAAVDDAPRRRRIPLLKGLAAATLATKLAAAGVAVAAVGSVVVTVAVEHRSHPRHHPTPPSVTVPRSGRPSDPDSAHSRTRSVTARPTAAPDRSATPSGLVTRSGLPTPLPSGLPSTAGVITSTPSRSKTPPGRTKTPPGRTKTPPGQTKSPPLPTRTPPDRTKTPPGQADRADG
jgi:hypothetical protein